MLFSPSYLVNHSCQHGLMDIYFILWIIIQYFVLWIIIQFILFKLFQLRPLGALSISSHVLQTYSHHCGLFLLKHFINFPHYSQLLFNTRYRFLHLTPVKFCSLGNSLQFSYAEIIWLFLLSIFILIISPHVGSSANLMSFLCSFKHSRQDKGQNPVASY